ncbi:hypothetical protein Mapa_007940 [Marchantia paleacea]|nr:hypothetical protein Mapa_007940 [Marchantia paleacea]
MNSKIIQNESTTDFKPQRKKKTKERHAPSEPRPSSPRYPRPIDRRKEPTREKNPPPSKSSLHEVRRARSPTSWPRFSPRRLYSLPLPLLFSSSPLLLLSLLKAEKNVSAGALRSRTWANEQSYAL